MRSCPACATSYPDGVDVCARDGQALIAAPSAVVSPDDPGNATTYPALPVAPGTTATGLAAPSSSSPSSSSPASSGSSPASAAAPAPVAATESSGGFDSLVGATLAGRYQIIRRIGEGGMGAVYEARHTIIGKRVAVKVLLEKFLTKSDFVARLLQEARLASAIGHEHIVDVTDFGTTDDGRAFVVMEFLDGEALAQLVMREAPLPVERSLRIARQVASALGAAHAKGIVHRDVKPENIYLIQRGDADFVKVVDFGISKAVKQGQGDDAPDYRLTHTGLLLGTPLYMSPEQARGEEDLDHRVDVWALGVLLYECLTGEVPFRANNYLGIISQVLTHEAPPPSRLRPELGISEAVESVVMRAMEKDRARRYPTMADVEADIERLLAGDQNVGAGAGTAPSTAPAPSARARGRVWIWGAAVAALVGGVAMVLTRPELPDANADHRSGAAAAPVPAASTAAATNDRRARAADARPGVGPAATAGVERSRSTADRASSSGTGTRVVAGDPTTSRRPTRPGNRLARDKVDRSMSPETGAAAPYANPDRSARRSSDAVLRGALPSRSGEGYPDTP